MNRGMTVKEGERVAISTSNLSASDESTKAEEIVFAVRIPPRLGQLEFIDERFTAILSFTQMDLAAQKVVYNHLAKNDITHDSFIFTVTNGLSEAKDGEFSIDIQPLDSVSPSLVANDLIEVLNTHVLCYDCLFPDRMVPSKGSNRHNMTLRSCRLPWWLTNSSMSVSVFNLSVVLLVSCLRFFFFFSRLNAW